MCAKYMYLLNTQIKYFLKHLKILEYINLI